MTPPDAQPDSEAPAPRWRRALRRVLRGLGYTAVVLIVLVLIVLGVLQTTWGSTKAARWIAGWANPFEDAVIQIGEAEGTWVGGLELRDVRLMRPTPPDSGSTEHAPIARLDTLRVRYRLWPLLRQHVHLREVTATGPSIALQQRADSSWSLPTLPPSEPDTAAAPSAWTVQADRIAVRRGTLTAEFFAPDRDSTLRVPDFGVRAHDLRTAPQLEGRLDTLYVRAQSPGSAVPLELRSQASLTDGRFRLGTLALDAPNSRVRSRGTLQLPDTPSDSLSDVDFTLQAAPLDFADLAPITPALGLNPEAVLQLEARAEGSGRRLHVTAEGDLSTGGTFTLDALATPTATAPSDTATLAYQGEAWIRDLNTAFLAAATPPTTNRLNADLQMALRGPSLDQLTGPVSAYLFDTRVSGYAVEDTRLTADFTDGETQLDLQGTVAGTSIRLDGTARPLDATPTYDLTARVDDLNIGTFAPESGQQSDLSFTSRLRGDGLDPQTASLTADVSLGPSTLNRDQLESGRLQVRLADGSIDIDAALETDDGGLSGAGQITLADPMRYILERAQLDRLDVAALAGDTTHSALSGTLRAEGSGTDPAALDLSTDFTLQDAFYGSYVLNRADGTLALNGGRLQSALQADLESGQLALNLSGTPFAEQPTFRLAESTFRGLDLGVLLQDSTQHTDLNGSVALQSTGLDPATMQASATVRLDSSQVNLQPVTTATLEASLNGGTVDADLQWTTPEGTSQLAGTVRDLTETPSYALRTGTLDGVDLGGLLNLPSARTRLNGSLALDGTGTDPATMALDARLALDRSTLNRATVRRGDMTVTLRSDTTRIASDLRLNAGRLRLNASGEQLATDPHYRADLHADSLDVAALLGADSVASHVSLTTALEGRGLSLDTMHVTGRLGAQPSRYGAVRVDTLGAAFQFTDGLLQIDTLTARSNIARLHGGGAIAVVDDRQQYTSDFLVEAELTSLDPLQRLIGAQSLTLDSGRIEGRIYGAPGTLRFDATTTLENLLYNGTRVGSFNGHIAGARGDTSLVSTLEARGAINYIDVPAVTVDSVKFGGEYDGREARFTSRVRLDADHILDLAGTANLSAQEVLLRRFNMRLGADRWTLLQDATVGYGDTYRVRNLLIYSDQQQLAADGFIDFDGPQSLIVTLEGFRMDAIAGLFGLEGLGGSLTGTLELDGPAEAPELLGTLNLDVRSDGESVGELELELDYADLRLQTDALLTHVNGSTLTLDGGLPLDLRLNTPDPDTTDIDSQPIDLTLSADAFSIGWIDPFLDPALARDAAGQFTAQVTIGGTRSQPDLDGQATVRNGSVYLPTQGTDYDAISADLQLQNNQVIVQEATMESGGGDLRAEGTVDLTELTLGTYDLDLTANDFLAVDTREYRAAIDGDVTLRGTTREPVLRGDVQVQSADFYLLSESSESDLATVQLTTEDQQLLERRFGIRLTEADTTTFDTYEALDMELQVDIERDVWLRSRANPEMDVQFTGSLDVSKAPYEAEQVFGTIEVVPERSRIVQFGRVFDITRGTLTFNGPAFEPILDLAATYEPRTVGTTESSVTITLSIDGRPDELDLALSSTPQMATSDIFCYIAVARPCGQFSGGQGGGLDGQELAGRVAFSQAANLIENLAASKLGLDVVRIENRATGTYLTAGQYLSPRFFASIEQAITTSANNPESSLNVPNITLEYELMRWLLIRALYRNPDFRLNLFWEYAY